MRVFEDFVKSAQPSEVRDSNKFLCCPGVGGVGVYNRCLSNHDGGDEDGESVKVRK